MEKKTNPPKCIGIIMDGNRRFARAKGLPQLEGHRLGYAKLKEVMGWVKEVGIDYLVVYAFSTENWNRTAEEVKYLMDLFRMVLSRELIVLKKEGIKVRCVGQRERFEADLRAMIEKAELETANLPGPTLVLAHSYGGRAEILNAVNKIVKSGIKEVDEKVFSEQLWTKDIPDPDLVIRTSGEMRLSGFLPWQSVYSEFFFTKTLWPDFDKEEFLKIISDYLERDRRKGK